LTAAVNGTACSAKEVVVNRPTKDDISLAAWSLVHEFRAGKWKNLDLPRICREDFGINGLEFVNTFFELPTYNYLRRLKKNAADHGVTLVLIMVDAEGGLGADDPAERRQVVINHRKWVDIAHFLGCHAIRVNCRGPEGASAEDTLGWASDSFSELLDYAAQAPLNVIIENHGGLSSDPDFLISLMKRVNRSHFGLLPDFGNFPDNIDKYEAIRKMVPYAKGISVKTLFKEDGTHPGYDVAKIIRICQEEGYKGFYGIESEGQEGDDWTKVRWTKKVIQETLNI
jgi:sugar phosphate isomerase/epimerase